MDPARVFQVDRPPESRDTAAMDTLQVKDRIRAGIVTPEAKREYVRDLFGRIAGRYDLTNDVMSGGLHRRWKRLAIHVAAIEKDHAVLDLAAGTGDFSLLVARDRKQDPDPALVIAADLTIPMMRHGQGRADASGVQWLGCDAMELPLRDETVDRVLVGYGLRNFPDLAACLS